MSTNKSGTACYSLLFVGLLFISCSNKTTFTNKDKSPTLIAWNEDTIKPYQLTLFKGNKFRYGITFLTTDKRIIKRLLTGKYRDASDTVYLFFNKDELSFSLNPFLIKDASRGYLIQTFTDTTKRIFLRVKNSGRLPFK